jgi:hypothetical protein
MNPSMVGKLDPRIKALVRRGLCIVKDSIRCDRKYECEGCMYYPDKEFAEYLNQARNKKAARLRK